jgi:tetratricopeptide (TPR) repeat protein
MFHRPKVQKTGILPPASEFNRCLAEGDALLRRHMDVREPSVVLEEAINAYLSALEFEPDSAIALARLARAFMLSGQLGKALAQAERALALDATQGDAYLVIGYCHLKQGRIQSACESLTHALRCPANLSFPARARMLLARAIAQLPKEVPGPLVRLTAWTLSPVVFLNGLLLLSQEKHQPTCRHALEAIGHLLKIYSPGCRKVAAKRRQACYAYYSAMPGLASAILQVADSLAMEGRREEARFWYQKAIDRDPLDLTAYFALARLCEELGQWDESIVLYRRMMGLSDQREGIARRLAQAFIALGDHEQAITHLKDAVTLAQRPEDRAGHYRAMANLYHRQLGNPEAAQVALLAAVELAPERVESWVELGILYYEKGELESARHVCEKALKRFPRNAQLQANLAYLFWMRGDVPAAVRHYERAIQADASYEVAQNNLGVLYLDNLGNPYRAIDLFRKAISLNEHYALAHYNLGRAYSLLDQKLDAATCFQNAQRINETTHELDSEDLEARLLGLFNSVSDPGAS